MSDLHIHSQHSDGTLTIKEIISYANTINLNSIAISDHDTVKSAIYSIKNPKVKNVNLIPAIELSAFDYKRNCRVHVLCYYPTITNELIYFCENMKNRRNFAFQCTKEILLQKYPKEIITMAQKFAKNSDVIYKQHILHALLYYGYTDKIYGKLYAYLFDKTSGAALFNPAYDNIYTVLKIIKNCKGISCIAHPGAYKNIALCEELASKGLIDCIEINHPRNTKEDIYKLQLIAKKFNLIITGGTDFHGMYSKKPHNIGEFTTNDKNINAMIELSKIRKSYK